MKTHRALWTGLGLALAFAVAVPMARAATWSDATQVTVNQPMEIPGNRVLPAGTYWFLRVGTQRSDVLIYDAKTTREIAAVLGLDNHTAVADTLANPMTWHPAPRLVFALPNRPENPVLLESWLTGSGGSGVQFNYSAHQLKPYSEGNQVTVVAKAAHIYTPVPPGTDE